MNMDKMGAILAGGVSVALGIKIILHPKWYSSVKAHQFDFTGYNIPFGIAWIIIGLVIIWIGAIKRKKPSGKDE